MSITLLLILIITFNFVPADQDRITIQTPEDQLQLERMEDGRWTMVPAAESQAFMQWEDGKLKLTDRGEGTREIDPAQFIESPQDLNFESVREVKFRGAIIRFKPMENGLDFEILDARDKQKTTHIQARWM